MLIFSTGNRVVVLGSALGWDGEYEFTNENGVFWLAETPHTLAENLSRWSDDGGLSHD